MIWDAYSFLQGFSNNLLQYYLTEALNKITKKLVAHNSYEEKFNQAILENQVYEIIEVFLCN